MARYASGKYAWAICDRCGTRGRYTRMVREPGTNFFVHPEHRMLDSNLRPVPLMPDPQQLRNPRPNVPQIVFSITADITYITADSTIITADQI